MRRLPNYAKLALFAEEKNTQNILVSITEPEMPYLDTQDMHKYTKKHKKKRHSKNTKESLNIRPKLLIMSAKNEKNAFKGLVAIREKGWGYQAQKCRWCHNAELQRCMHGMIPALHQPETVSLSISEGKSHACLRNDTINDPSEEC